MFCCCHSCGAPEYQSPPLSWWIYGLQAEKIEVRHISDIALSTFIWTIYVYRHRVSLDLGSGDFWWLFAAFLVTSYSFWRPTVMWYATHRLDCRLRTSFNQEVMEEALGHARRPQIRRVRDKAGATSSQHRQPPPNSHFRCRLRLRVWLRLRSTDGFPGHISWLSTSFWMSSALLRTIRAKLKLRASGTAVANWTA